MAEPVSLPFRPRARLLQLLGDQLIGSPRLAVFELVKNAYDADAPNAAVRLVDIDDENATIEVLDLGEGMDLKTITDIWLEPGADHREEQRRKGERTPIHGRLPLGEKGVGRFAVHKLGEKIDMVTRREGHPELTVRIDWRELTRKRYMDEADVKIYETDGSTFPDGTSGTKITISALRAAWARGEVRQLSRNITSICSPFGDRMEAFSVTLDVPGHEQWIEGLLKVPDILDRAMWKYWFWFENGSFEWTYEFTPIPGLKIQGRKEKGIREPLELLKGDRKRVDEKFAPASMSEGVGPVTGEFYVYDRDKEVLRFLNETKAFTEALDDNGGVRVYRDGIRVYNYGEQGDDWLGLDLRRVNIPAQRVSNNLIIGAVDVSLDESLGLIEKTNREGFVETKEFSNFRAIVLASLAKMEVLRRDDKTRIKKLLSGEIIHPAFDLDTPIDSLRVELKKRDLNEDLGKYVDTIERRYHDMQEVVTHSGVAGLNLAMVFHEVERGVRGLNTAISEEVSSDQLKVQCQRLVDILGGFATLLRRDAREVRSIKKIVEEALFISDARFRNHQVVVSCPLNVGEEEDFDANVSFGMLLGVLSNLIDNSLYWLDVRWPDRENTKTRKRIYIGVSDDLPGGKALVVADNGTGLQGDPHDLVQPFVTRKIDGMGLGLYYANLVMELNGGQLYFPEKGEVELPRGMNGAVVALIFKDAE